MEGTNEDGQEGRENWGGRHEMQGKKSCKKGKKKGMGSRSELEVQCKKGRGTLGLNTF